MTGESPLQGKLILAVDDEQDVLDTISEELDICTVHQARDYATAIQYLLSYTYDLVILDIMGVNGFELLKQSVNLDFPSLMLTAHALTPESLKRSIKLGAVGFLPKENISSIRVYLEDVLLNEGKPVWRKLFDRLGEVFDRRFGPDWKEKDRFFQEFEDSLRKEAERGL